MPNRAMSVIYSSLLGLFNRTTTSLPRQLVRILRQLPAEILRQSYDIRVRLVAKMLDIRRKPAFGRLGQVALAVMADHNSGVKYFASFSSAGNGIKLVASL